MHLVPTLIGFGVITGATTAVPALGLTLMYGSSRFLNFAYGEWMTLGAFLTFSLAKAMPLGAAIAAAIVLVTAFGPLVNRFVFQPLSDRPGLVLLITSLGLSFVLRNSISAIWGQDVRSLPTPHRLARSEFLGPFRFTLLQLIILAVAVATMLALAYLLRRTDLGLQVRAAAENRDLARASGISVGRISAVAWALSSALAAGGGIMIALTAAFTPSLGFTLLLIVASAIILGGLGNAVGAVIGAFVIGIAMEVSTAWIDPALKPGIAFATLALVLLIRPGGLLGSAPA